MAHLKATSALLLLLFHGCVCQQQSTYSVPSQTKLEDIERDNLKSAAQSQTPTPPAQSPVPSQYLQYPTQDQSYYNLLAQQQSASIFAPGQQAATAGVGQQLYALPNQQSAASLFAAQQQPLFYYNPSPQPQQQQQLQQLPQQQQQQPVYDFSGLPLFQSAYPYVLPQQGNLANVLPADYYKNIPLTAGQAKTPTAAAAAGSSAGAGVAGATLPAQAYKNVPGFQFNGNYYIPTSSQSALYQPVSFQQPQNAAQYYYNSLYQLQSSPQKSVYAAGVKSTTPASPTKAKEEQQYVPIGTSNYRLEYSAADQLSNYGKVRLSG